MTSITPPNSQPGTPQSSYAIDLSHVTGRTGARQRAAQALGGNSNPDSPATPDFSALIGHSNINVNRRRENVSQDLDGLDLAGLNLGDGSSPGSSAPNPIARVQGHQRRVALDHLVERSPLGLLDPVTARTRVVSARTLPPQPRLFSLKSKLLTFRDILMNPTQLEVATQNVEVAKKLITVHEETPASSPQDAVAQEVKDLKWFIRKQTAEINIAKEAVTKPIKILR